MSAAVPLPRLAPRELEVLDLMARGRSNAGIAAQLCLSSKTIEWYIQRIFETLAVPVGARYNRRVCAVLWYLAMPIGERAPRFVPDVTTRAL